MDVVLQKLVEVLKANVKGIKTYRIGQLAGEPNERLLPICYVFNQTTQMQSQDTSNIPLRNQSIVLQIVVAFNNDSHIKDPTKKVQNMYSVIQGTDENGYLKEGTLLRTLQDNKRLSPSHNWFISVGSDVNVDYSNYADNKATAFYLMAASVSFDIRIN